MLRDRILHLTAEGRTRWEIATTLGVAVNTVRYHQRRAASAGDGTTTRRAAPAPPEPARSTTRTRTAVALLLAEGISRAEIARRLGISKATVSYHARRLGAPIDVRCARRYDWAAVQRYYDAGHSARECMAAFGCSSQSWHAAVHRGELVTRPAAMPAERLFAANTPRSRSYLKMRLLALGLKEDRCERCGLDEWLGERLSTHLHHRNGDGLDNRVENLQLLCPNCHSQTDTWGGRKRGARGAQTEARA